MQHVTGYILFEKYSEVLKDKLANFKLDNLETTVITNNTVFIDGKNFECSGILLKGKINKGISSNELLTKISSQVGDDIKSPKYDISIEDEDVYDPKINEGKSNTFFTIKLKPPYDIKDMRALEVDLVNLLSPTFMVIRSAEKIDDVISLAFNLITPTFYIDKEKEIRGIIAMNFFKLHQIACFKLDEEC